MEVEVGTSPRVAFQRLAWQALVQGAVAFQIQQPLLLNDAFDTACDGYRADGTHRPNPVIRHVGRQMAASWRVAVIFSLVGDTEWLGRWPRSKRPRAALPNVLASDCIGNSHDDRVQIARGISCTCGDKRSAASEPTIRPRSQSCSQSRCTGRCPSAPFATKR